jgi:single-strand DNA-binding protein
MLFTGRLTGKAEVKTVKEKGLINFTVAINQKWKNSAGEKMEKTVFVDCTYWRNTGLAGYLGKGAVVEILGWVEAEAYQSSIKGLQSRLVCTCDSIKLFSPMTKNEDPAESVENLSNKGNPIRMIDPGAAAGTAGMDDDDLPF